MVHSCNNTEKTCPTAGQGDEIFDDLPIDRSVGPGDTQVIPHSNGDVYIVP